MEQPLVSVTVITYNSSQTVLETLDSIKAQTYQNIELIVSDDCSTDNTVEVCQAWLEKNKDRFVRTELLTVEKNTGVSGNLNRAEAVCKGEWVKPIAGDDLLLVTCLQDCMYYVEEHENVVLLFGRCKAFGASQERCDEINNVFDYTFFDKTIEEQLHQLVFVGNCIPATTVFYNCEKVQKLGIKNDERIPLLEDWPKWINFLRVGVKFHFLDKETVFYRVGGISTGKPMNVNQYKTSRLFFFYYQFPEWIKENKENTIGRIVAEECEVYFAYKETDRRLSQVLESKAYCIGKFILRPVRVIKEIINGKK